MTSGKRQAEGKQHRLEGQEIPKPIIGIHNYIDEIERTKEERKDLGDKIKDAKAALVGLMKKNKDALEEGPNGSIVYARLGYYACVHLDEKVDTKRG